MKSVEFFFDIVSPASYLAWTQLPKIAEETGAEIIYRPFFLPGVFEKAGSSSPITSPNKGKWAFQDFNRYAKRYGVPLNMNSRFPLSSVYVMRGLNNYSNSDTVKKLGDGFYDCMWVSNGDINDPVTVQKICQDAGVDPNEYQTKLNDPANKQALVDVTDEAVSRGVFGAPTFFIGDVMHWGQDRLEFVREELL
ncbi:MAG: 2-hydroxychromene-2-carboxylate isomerase [Pseudomonadota bacterium]